MKPQTYKLKAEEEDRHWWNLSRLKLTADYINAMKLGPQARILDVGCGTGGTTKFLEQYGHVTGIDKSEIGLQYARGKAKKTTFVEGDANDIDHLFPQDHFDLITLFNTLYHQWIPDDLLMLNKVKKILKPGGHVLITESAFKILMRRHDVLDMGKTRYKLSDFKIYFKAANLKYECGQYFNIVSFPICLALSSKEYFFSTTDPDLDDIKELVTPPAVINNVMKYYMEIERRFLKRSPLGVSLVVVGQKEVQ